MGDLEVRLGAAVVEGAWADESASVVAFKGLRYAQPPVAERRWQPPAELASNQGLEDSRHSATSFGSRCPQLDGERRPERRVARAFDVDAERVPEIGETDEDCLFLNVWTGSLGSEEPAPVMVWIHGGANVWGGGDDPRFDGTALARRGVVVVTLNYRLGLLGFLAHPELSAESEHGSSGNYGLLDQVAALRWVRDHIAVFGGDPERVTIFGGSSGAADVLYLMTSPLSEGLFHRAIAQSGVPGADNRTLKSQELRGERLIETLGLHDSSNLLKDLRAVPVERLLEAGVDHLNEEFDCAPVTDGWAVPDFPGRVLSNGAQRDVPLLLGSNSDEWAGMGSYSSPVTVRGLDGWLASIWGPLEGRALELYGADSKDEVAASVSRWQTDHWFSCPARFAARSMDAVSSPAFLYEFTQPVRGDLGAYHGAEVEFAFDNLGAESWLPEPSGAELASFMADYWVAFASSGDPNRDGLPEWPPYDAETSPYLELGDPIRAQRELRDAECSLWDDWLVERLR